MKKRTLLLGLAALIFPSTVTAQYTIYPVPHQQVAGTGQVAFTPAVTAVCEDGIDAATRQRLTDIFSAHGITVEFSTSASDETANVFLGINGSNGAADQVADDMELSRDVFATANKYDRHLLSLTAGDNGQARLVVLGETTDAAFYGLASLEQMLDGGAEQLPCVEIHDYADQKSRGLVEGYYGVPYSVEVKKDLMRFMMRYKMNTYLYGAKSDPYHSNNWQDAYPTSLTDEQVKWGWLSQDMVQEVTDVSHATKVNFIWAIHPGNNFVGDEQVIDKIMGKFEKMYALGVRQFGVFVDDVAIPSSDADMATNAKRLTDLQHAIEKKWNQTYTSAADTVRALHFVPQIYCRTFASSEDQYNRFFQALRNTPDYVTIYTTGWAVWSVPNAGDLDLPKAQLGRSVAWWWNYPCNDNGVGPSQLYPMDTYSNFYDMPNVDSNATLPSALENGLGIVCNPMQQGEVSKTALFSVADYAWNAGSFDNNAAWEASFKGLFPGNETARQAYRFLAPYLRYNDPQELQTLFTRYKQTNDPAALNERMQELVTNCDVLIGLKESSVDGERLLYKDIEPWLLKLRAMATVTQEMLAAAAMENEGDAKWNAYLAGLEKISALSTDEAYQVYMLSGLGASISSYLRLTQPSYRYFLPFIDYMKAHALDGYFSPEEAPTRPETLTNVEGAKLYLSGGSSAPSLYQRQACTLQKGEFVALQLPVPTRLTDITVADTLLQNFSVVLSPDGKQWTRLTDASVVPDGFVRYAAVVNDDETPKSLKLESRKSLQLTLQTAPSVKSSNIPAGDVWDGHSANYMSDGDYSTFVCLNRNQASGDIYSLELTEAQPVQRVRIVMGTTNGDYMKNARVQISADGTRWTTLKVAGTTNTVYTVELKQNFAVSDEALACDFDGEGREAKFVRLNITSPNTEKWLRLYEIEVNGKETYQQSKFYDGKGRAYDEPVDGDASTSTAAATTDDTEGEFVYYFQNYTLLDGVTLYCDPATMTEAHFAISHNGTDWTEVEPAAEGGIVRISLSGDERNASALRVTWDGDTTPGIHEIIEQADETEFPLVTRIEQIAAGGSSSATPAIRWQDGKLVAQSPAGIAAIEVYTTEGRKLLSRTSADAKAVTLPRLRAAGQPLVVKVTLGDGTVQSFKVM